MILYINPKILTWARERSGYSVEELAEKANKNYEEIEMWEAGAGTPSYSCLEHLADYLKMPVAVFFSLSHPIWMTPKRSSEDYLTMNLPDCLLIRFRQFILRKRIKIL